MNILIKDIPKTSLHMKEYLSINTTTGGSVSSNLCTSGHIIVWAGDPHYEIPDGTPCSCGMTVGRRVTCPTCGHIEMKMVEREARP